MGVTIADGGVNGTVAPGLNDGALNANYFRIFQVMSNELNTPKITFCPAEYETTRTLATTFASTIVAGQSGTPFTNNNNISYFVGIDANDTNPQMLLTGDHNIGTATANNNTLAATTGYKNQMTLGGATGTQTGTNTATAAGAWMDNQHQKQGNVGMADGSVQGFSIAKLREAWKNSGDGQNNRLLMP